jgi:hypothetical protein
MGTTVFRIRIELIFRRCWNLITPFGYRTPMAVWRERMQAAKAVDMMDNADALTTCPQQQQQTESLAA